MNPPSLTSCYLTQDIQCFWLPSFSSYVKCQWQLYLFFTTSCIAEGVKGGFLRHCSCSQMTTFSFSSHFSSHKNSNSSLQCSYSFQGRTLSSFHVLIMMGVTDDWFMLFPGKFIGSVVLIWPKRENFNDRTAGSVINSLGSYLGPGRILKFSKNCSTQSCLSHLHLRPGLPSWSTFGHAIYNTHQDGDSCDITYTASAS